MKERERRQGALKETLAASTVMLPDWPSGVTLSLPRADFEERAAGAPPSAERVSLADKESRCLRAHLACGR